MQTHLVWIPARLAPYRFGRARRSLEQKVQRGLVSDVALYKADGETSPFSRRKMIERFQKKNFQLVESVDPTIKIEERQLIKRRDPLSIICESKKSIARGACGWERREGGMKGIFCISIFKLLSRHVSCTNDDTGVATC